MPLPSSAAEEENSKLTKTLGNVTYVCPAIHPHFAIPCPPGAFNHTPGFTACAGTDEAHAITVRVGKGLAVAGWRVLSDDAVANKVAEDWRRDVEERQREEALEL